MFINLKCFKLRRTFTNLVKGIDSRMKSAALSLQGLECMRLYNFLLDRKSQYLEDLLFLKRIKVMEFLDLLRILQEMITNRKDLSM